MTELDVLLTGTSARWVHGDEVLGPAEIEAHLPADLHSPGGQTVDAPSEDVIPISTRQTSVTSWPASQTPGDLHSYRLCWRQGGTAVCRPRGVDWPVVPVPWFPPPDAAVVLFTTGSTGAPKGVIHTHASLAHKTRQMVGVHGLTADDTVLMPAPLSHMSGLLNGLLVPGAAGMTTVLMDRWNPNEALDLIEQWRVTFMVGPPTFFIDLWRAEGFSPSKVASLRLVSCGGAGVTEAFVDEASEQLGAVVKRTYGSTEAPTVATTPVQLHDDRRRATTEGIATPGTELRVVDGELQVRGPELFWGYLDPAQTAEVMTDDGFYRTGDRADLDAGGWLTITGRVKDLIIRGGENISPAQVEATLEAHPAVAHAVAVGLPDERLGERVAAFVVLASEATSFDLDECRRWFEERGAPRFTTPERIEVVDDLPRLASGKPDRVALRARLP